MEHLAVRKGEFQCRRAAAESGYASSHERLSAKILRVGPVVIVMKATITFREY